MNRSTLTFRLAGGMFAAVLLFGACGGGSDEGDSAGEGDAASGECGGSGGTTLTVEASDFQFEPSEFSAAAGEQVTVEFTNTDDAPHTFTIDDLECDTGSIDSGQSAELSFTMPEADMGFICTIHPDMKGTLTPE
ncbi:MAG: cupredoxin domain-containing protein [Actinomycetota bacterium]|nr:cupredoxin domain-containing protein [Actinomycetota bacterium]